MRAFSLRHMPGARTKRAGCLGTLLRMALILALCACGPLISPGTACGDDAVYSIVWNGVESLSTGALEEAAGLRGRASINEQDLEAAAGHIVGLYRAEGYLEASASLVMAGAGRKALCISVDEGRRFTVGDVTLEGESCLLCDELILGCPGLERGAPITKYGLESSFRALLRAYGEAGYAECRVSPKSFLYKEDASVDVTLQVTEGRRCVVERLDISGGKTKSGTVSRTAGIKEGEPFDPWRMNEVVRRLSSSGLFSSVGEPVVKMGSADSLVVIEIPVVEPPSSSVSGLLGYSGRQGGAMGFMDLELGNIMGTGREGSFRWENSGGGLSLYSAGYVEPWLGGFAAALDLGVEHLAQDSTYSTTAFSADLRVNPGGTLSLALGVGMEKTSLAGETEGAAARRSRLALRTGIRLDVRDNPVDPRGGLLLAASGDWGSRKDGISGLDERKSWSVARYDLQAGFHRRLVGRHGLFLGARWRGVKTNEGSIPVDQLLRFGGAASLRGYREEQFRAKETGLLQLEHRIAFGGGGSRIFLFTDVGVLRGGGAPDGALVGYGLGIRAAGAGGQVGVDFGMGRGDSWSEAKVHVRMKRLF
jgi:outer membrane protein assembly factor BamA